MSGTRKRPLAQEEDPATTTNPIAQAQTEAEAQAPTQAPLPKRHAPDSKVPAAHEPTSVHVTAFSRFLAAVTPRFVSSDLHALVEETLTRTWSSHVHPGPCATRVSPSMQVEPPADLCKDTRIKQVLLLLDAKVPGRGSLGCFEPLGAAICGVWSLLSAVEHGQLRSASLGMRRSAARPSSAARVKWRGGVPKHWTPERSPVHTVYYSTLVPRVQSPQSIGDCVRDLVWPIQRCATLQEVQLCCHPRGPSLAKTLTQTSVRPTVSVEPLTLLVQLRSLALYADHQIQWAGLEALSKLDRLTSLTARYVDVRSLGLPVSLRKLELALHNDGFYLMERLYHSLNPAEFQREIEWYTQSRLRELVQSATLTHLSVSGDMVNLVAKEVLPAHLGQAMHEQLSTLSLHASQGVTPWWLVHAGLRHLTLAGNCYIQSSEAPLLESPCPAALETLDVSQFMDVGGMVMRVVPWLLSGRTKETLQVLHAANLDLDVLDAKIWDELPRLKSLDVSKWTKMPCLTRVRALTLRGDPQTISDQVVQLPRCFPNLVSLRLKQLAFPGDAAHPLASLSKLGALSWMVGYAHAFKIDAWMDSILGHQCPCTERAVGNHAPSLRLVQYDAYTPGSWVQRARARRITVSDNLDLGVDQPLTYEP